MIVLQSVNDAPGESTGLSCKTNTVTSQIPTPEDESDFCSCLIDCDYEEKVFFYEPDPENLFKNDKTAILFDMVDPSGTYVIELIKPDGQIEVLSNDDFGTLFPVGFNDSQPLKTGYLIDWLKVYQQTGIKGLYSFRVTVDNFGVEVVKDSWNYLLYSFTQEDANGTVKIETVNNGVILNGEDYRGIEWYRSIRLRGKLDGYTPEYEEISSLDSNDRPVQIQPKITKSYTLTLYPDKSNKLIPFIQNDLLAREIFISSYDQNTFIKYNRIELTPKSIEPGGDYNGTVRRWFTFEFMDKTPLIKRNLP